MNQHTMPEGTVFDVIDGPFCLQADSGNAIRWYGIRMSNGTTGWSPEASNSTYALEPWSGGSSSGNSGGSSGTISGSGSTGGNSNGGSSTFEDARVVFRDGTSFTLRFNYATGEIANGAEFIEWEIQRILRRMVNVSTARQYQEAIRYNAERFGELVRLQEDVEARLCGTDIACKRNLRFLVGNQRMDTSGPGNVAFGYIMGWMGISQEIVEDPLSNVAQLFGSFVTDHEIRFTDFPDDRNQRRMGRVIFVLAGEGFSTRTIIQAADAVGGLAP